MLYAQFDQDGKITGLTETPRQNTQPVSLRDPAVLEFLSINDDTGFDPDQFLDQSDKGTIRILEDLIDTLVEHHLIRFTDLPMAAQKKLLGRKFARTLVREESEAPEVGSGNTLPGSNLLNEDDDKLF